MKVGTVVVHEVAEGGVEIQWHCSSHRPFRGFFDELFELIPDLTGEVHGWRPTGTGASVDLELTGTLAGHRIRLLSRDELTLHDGRLLGRRAVLERRGLLRIAAQPSAWPALVRMIRLSR